MLPGNPVFAGLFVINTHVSPKILTGYKQVEVAVLIVFIDGEKTIN